MQVVIVLASCLLAVVSVNGQYNAGPVDTYEVQAAKAAHFRAYNEIASKNAAPAYAHQAAPAYAHQGYAGQSNAGPVETYEVQAAKAAHFRAHAEIAAKNNAHSGYAHQAAPAYAQHASPIHHGGVPVPVSDTYEVQAAKAAHFRAHAEAAAQSSPHGYAQQAPINAYAHQGYGQVAAGPVDTYEVQAARAAHLQAHAEASRRYRRGLVAAPLAYASPLGYASPLAYASPLGYASPLAVVAPRAYGYSSVTAHGHLANAALAHSFY